MGLRETPARRNLAGNLADLLGLLRCAGMGDGPPSDQELQQMLEKREEFRRARDYDQADAIRDQMRARGVRLDDRSKTWQSDDGRSGTFGDGGGGGMMGGGGGYGGGGYGGGGGEPTRAISLLRVCLAVVLLCRLRRGWLRGRRIWRRAIRRGRRRLRRRRRCVHPTDSPFVFFMNL